MITTATMIATTIATTTTVGCGSSKEGKENDTTEGDCGSTPTKTHDEDEDEDGRRRGKGSRRGRGVEKEGRVRQMRMKRKTRMNGRDDTKENRCSRNECNRAYVFCTVADDARRIWCATRSVMG